MKLMRELERFCVDQRCESFDQHRVDDGQHRCYKENASENWTERLCRVRDSSEASDCWME